MILKSNIRKVYEEETMCPFPYDDLHELKDTLQEEFKRNVSGECITGDLNTYWAYIAGLASGGIDSRLPDDLERYKTKEWLEKSFFDWFPKYRFLQRYDFSEYEALNRDMRVYDKLRIMLLELIRIYERYEQK
jgi:hypothetical protein